MLNELDKNHFKITSRHLSLNLLGNKITCFCPHIQFLKWLTRTNINFINMEQYTCESPDKTQVQLSHNLNTIIAELESECSSNIWLIYYVAGLATHFAMVTLTTVLFRFQTFSQVFVVKNAHASRTIGRCIGNK